MSILDRIRTMVTMPRPLQAAAAGVAIAWGTGVAAHLADQCSAEISAAEERLAALNEATDWARSQLATLDDQLEQTGSSRTPSDAVVKARAAALGWGPPVDVDELVAYVIENAESTGAAAETAAAVRFYFSAGGRGGGLRDIDDVPATWPTTIPEGSGALLGAVLTTVPVTGGLPQDDPAPDA